MLTRVPVWLSLSLATCCVYPPQVCKHPGKAHQQLREADALWAAADVQLRRASPQVRLFGSADEKLGLITDKARVGFLYLVEEHDASQHTLSFT